MYSFSFQSHPIIEILSLSKQIRTSSDKKFTFSPFLKNINEFRSHQKSHHNTPEVKDEKENALDPLKVIAAVSLLLQSIKFRSFSDEDLHKIYDMILNGSTLTEIDNKYEFAFPFFSDSLNDITFQSIKDLVLFLQKRKKSRDYNSTHKTSSTTSETQKNKKSTDTDFSIDLNNENVIESLSIFIFFILYSSISWMTNSERTKTSQGLLVLLEKLDLIIFLFTNFPNLNTNSYLSLNENRDKFFLNFTSVRKIATDTFLFLSYYAVANFSDFTFTDEIFGLLNDFFSKIIYKNKNAQKAKPITSKQSKTAKKNSDSIESENDTFLNSIHILLYFLSIELNKSSEKVPPLCNFISQVIENQSHTEFLTDELYTHIFHILAGKLSELDETILQFFVRLSNQFNIKDEKVLIHFPTFLVDFLKDHTENPVKIVDKDEMNDTNDTSEFILIRETEKVTIINYREIVQNFQFNFLSDSTFDNGLILTQNTEVPPALRVYLPNEVVSRIDLVSELFSGTLFTDQFMKVLAAIDHKTNFNDFLYYLAVFLSICEDQREISPHFIMTIFNSPLFEGKYEDCRNKNNDRLKFVSSLIYSSLSLAIHSDSLESLMEPIINTKLYLPTVLTTIFQDLNIIINYNPRHYHCRSNEEDKNEEKVYTYFRSQPFIMIFYSVSLFYQTANVNDRENTAEIEKCRVSLLLFMESFIREWSSSRLFNLMFLSYLFEPSLQHFVLSHFNVLLTPGSCDANFFTSVFESCQLLLNSDKEEERNKSISLMYNVLKVVNSMISRSNNSDVEENNSHIFNSLHKPLTDILIKLKKDEIEFICEIIEYFAITSDSNCIDPYTVQSFSDAIQKIGMTNEIRTKLIRLLAGNQAPSIVSHFSIEQPYALPLFVTLFISENNSDQLNDNFKLLEQLVTFSNKNAIMCHKGNLDYILLDFIDNCISIIAKKERNEIRKLNSNDDSNLVIKEVSQFELYLSNYFKIEETKERNVINEDEEDNKNTMNINLFRKVLMKKDQNELKNEIENAMSLFIKISLVKSSIQIVRKYISLLSTSLRTKDLLIEKNEKLSQIYRRIASFYLKNLTDIISSKFRMPTTFLPISEIRTPEIEINNISASLFTDGFTATFWVYLIQKSVKRSSILFTLTDSEENEVTAKIIDTSFIIYVIHNSKKTTFTLNTIFPSSQWFLTSITVLRDKKEDVYLISASINSTPIFGDFQIDYFEFQSPIKITINGKDSNSVCLSDSTPTFKGRRNLVKRSYSNISYNNGNDELFDRKLRNRRSGSTSFVVEVENNESDDCALLGPFGFFQPFSLINSIQMHQSGPRCIPTSTIKDKAESDNESRAVKMININSSLAPSFLSSDLINLTSNSNKNSDSDSNSSPSVTKIIYIHFDKMNGVFNIINDDNTLSKKHTICLKGPKYHQTLSFDEVLVQFFKIQSLIPLFKYEEENADEIVSLFSMLLSLGTYVQTNFHQCHGFSTISHILKEYEPKHLTYSLYSKFVNLNNQLTVQKLKNDLIENIIIRLDLWCLSSSIETKQRIIKHWLLINSNFDTNFNGKFKTFDEVMFSLDFFKEIQLKQNLLKLLFKVENNDQISLENTNKFIEFIICQCETYKNDVTYLLEFLIENCPFFAPTNLFVNLANLLSNNSFVSKEDEKDNNINFIMIIELFNKLYKHKKIQKPRYFYQLINSIIDQIPLEIFEKEENILKLIEYSRDIPECLSILFYGIAFIINDNESSNISLISDSYSSSLFLSNDELNTESDTLLKVPNESSSSKDKSEYSDQHLTDPKINLVIENLKPSGNYCFSKKWFLWPIISAFKINDNFFTNFIMNFIVTSIAEDQNNKPQEQQQQQQNSNQNQEQSQIKFASRFNWMNVFVLINLVGESISSFLLNKNHISKLNRLKEIDTFNFIKIFLNVLFLKEKEKDELIEFFNLCHFFIFFKPLWYENRALQVLYNRSQFHRLSRRSSSMKSNRINRISNCSKSDIFNQLKENYKKERNYKFSLRFDDEGNWIDRDFTIQIIEESSQISDFLKINKMIKYLINKQNPVDSTTNQNKKAPKNFNSFTHAISSMIPFMIQINNLFLSLGNSITKEFPIPKNKELIQSIKSQRSLFNRNIKMIDEFCHCCWSQLWITLNAESMPWRLKIEPKSNDDENDTEDQEFINQLHYQYPHVKLDFTPCYSLCPMKLKKDFHYVKHKSLREIQLIELQKLYQNKLKKKDDDSIDSKNFMKKIIEKIKTNQEHDSKKRRDSQQLQQSQQQQQQKQQQSPLIFSFFSSFGDSQSPNKEAPSNVQNVEVPKNHPIIKVKCELITIKRKMRGHCFFYQDKIELSVNKRIKDKNITEKNENNSNNSDIKDSVKKKYVKKVIEIYYDEIRLILSRMILHHPSGIEIFTYLRNSYLLNFPRLQSSDVLSKFTSICPIKNICILSFPSQPNSTSFSSKPFDFQSPSVSPQMMGSSAATMTSSVTDNLTSAGSSIYSSLPFYLSSLTNLWKNGYVSNFNYLIELNMLSGRSFNDPSMYPVFPWIVRDYDSPEIRWKDKDFFRDLSLPVGALNKERLDELVQRRKEMVQFNADFIFLYGAGYSTPLSLFNWMIRLEPFASLHVEMQNGHFDHPHRMFFSIKTAYKLSTSNSNDYRELIPEFFFLPGFLENKNKFNFGYLEDSFTTMTDDGSKKDDEKETKLNINDNENQSNNEATNSDEDESKIKDEDSENQSNNETTNSDEDESKIKDENSENQSNTSYDDEDESKTKDEDKVNQANTINKDEDESETKDEDKHDSVAQNGEEETHIPNIKSQNTFSFCDPSKRNLINDVELPSWASSPIDFIYKHRKILESKHISRHINEWIDLIFGVEQRNHDNNQFHPWMYSNVWEKRQQQIKQRQGNKPVRNVVISTTSSYIGPSTMTLLSSSSSNSSISLNATSSDKLPDVKSQLEPSDGADKSNEQADDEEMIGIPSVFEIEEFLTECGQIPQQLFTEKHPVKQKMKKELLLKEDLVVRISSVKKPFISSSSSGERSNQNNDTSSLFFYAASSPIPATYTNKEPKEKLEVSIDYATFVRKAKVGNDSKEKLIFLYVTNEGLPVKATVSLSGIDCDYLSSNKISDNNDSQKKYQFFRGYLASSLETGNVKITNLNSGGIAGELKGHIGKLNCLSSDQILLISSGSDTLTNIYDHKFSLLFSIPSFRSEIISSYVNSNFSIVANLTLDSSLILISTSTGTITKVISLYNRQPLSVIVTNAWGFIVVFAEENIYNKQKDKYQICHFFLLYSIDGEKICEKKVDFISSISAWMTFTSCDGFDFLAVCNDKGDLYVFEVYPYLTSTVFNNDRANKEKIDINDDLIDVNAIDDDKNSSSSTLEPIFKSNMDVITLFYWNDWRIIIGIGSNGHAFFVPLDYH